MSALPLDPTGPFALLNAPPQLLPGGSAELQVRFTPTRQLDALESLVLRAAGCTLVASLGGQGVSPTLRIEPVLADAKADAKKGGEPAPAEPMAEVALGGGRSACVVHVGDAIAGDELTAAVDLVNTSEFPLRYTLRTRGRGHRNRGPLPPFDASPAQATIGTGCRQRLTVRFAPDHASAHFWELVHVACWELLHRHVACLDLLHVAEPARESAAADGTARTESEAGGDRHLVRRRCVALRRREVGSARVAVGEPAPGCTPTRSRWGVPVA